MFIYLLRHAVAVDRSDANLPNDDRPLTKDGREKMRKAAQGMSRLITEPVDVILTSPLSRAHDTALIAAEAMGCEDKVEVCPELSPGSSYPKLIAALSNHQHHAHVMLVGHAPDLNYIASALLGSASPIVELKKGALCCVEIASLTGRMEGKLLWLMQPKQLRQLAKES
jgi:phosphohistidine phosphatase